MTSRWRPAPPDPPSTEPVWARRHRRITLVPPKPPPQPALIPVRNEYVDWYAWHSVFWRYVAPIALVALIAFGAGQGREHRRRVQEVGELTATIQNQNQTNRNILALLEDRDRFLTSYRDSILVWTGRGLLPGDYLPVELRGWNPNVGGDNREYLP